jgi:BirA family biotin operon repressor/biotin-[acetyl-CoA-carboxylase] ligase
MVSNRYKFSFPHIHFTKIDSTNKYLRENLSNISPLHGFMAISDFQTEGKGQYGRIWESDSQKNILCTTVLDCSFLQIDQIFGLHLIAAISVYELIKKYVNSNIKIKWPNDIYIDDKKCAGILIENVLKSNHLQWSLFGIGINVFQERFNSAEFATSLQLNTTSTLSLQDLIIDLREALLLNYEKLKQGQFQNLLVFYNSVLYKANEEVVFEDKSSQSWIGIVRNVSADGRLNLDKNKCLISINYGDYIWKNF